MPSRFAAATNKEMWKLIKQAVPEMHEEGDEALSFLHEFIDKTDEKVICLQMQISLKSCVTLSSWLVHK